MPNPTTAGDVLVALTHLRTRFPKALDDSGWQKLQADLGRLVEATPQAPADPEQVGEEMLNTVRQALARSPAAYPVFLAGLAEVQELRHELEARLAEVAADLSPGGSPGQAAALALAAFAPVTGGPASERAITGTPEEGMASRKAGNLLLNLEKLGEVLAHGMLFGVHTASDPNPILVAAGAILLGLDVWRGTKVKLSELDACVYWGMLKARVPGSDSANEAAIVQHTNQERHGRHPFTPEEVRSGLESLAAMRSVAPVPGKPTEWRIAERYVPPRKKG
jgi:hypothetical protein